MGSNAKIELCYTHVDGYGAQYNRVCRSYVFNLPFHSRLPIISIKSFPPFVQTEVAVARLEMQNTYLQIKGEKERKNEFSGILILIKQIMLSDGGNMTLDRAQIVHKVFRTINDSIAKHLLRMISINLL